MKNNEIEYYFIKEMCTGKTLKLYNKKITLCTNEEKIMYKVDVKFDTTFTKFYIVEHTFEDSGTYYKTYQTGLFWNGEKCFQDLDKAKEYLIEEAKKEKLL
jgi:hypothetical protein